MLGVPSMEGLGVILPLELFNGIEQRFSVRRVIAWNQNSKIHLEVACGVVGVTTDIFVWVRQCASNERDGSLQVQLAAGTSDVTKPQDRVSPDVEVWMVD